MVRKFFISLVLICSVLLQGCISFNSLADAKSAKGTGLSKDYSASKQTVWTQTISIIRQSKLSLINDDVDSGLILAQQPISPLSLTAGQNVAIFVSENNGKTHVEVVGKKAIGSIEFTSRNWESYIIEMLDKRLM